MLMLPGPETRGERTATNTLAPGAATRRISLPGPVAAARQTEPPRERDAPRPDSRGSAPHSPGDADRRVRVHSALAALAKGVSDPDHADLEELVEALREALAGASADEMSAVLDTFRETTDPGLLDSLASALKPHGLARPEVLAALGALAERDTSEVRRAAAITALGLAPPDDALVGYLDRLARTDPAAEVRAAAVKALGSSLESDPARGAAILERLLEVVLHDDDGGVRAAAIWSLRGRDADATAVGQLVRVLGTDRDLGPRQAAAETLADVGPEHRLAALAALEGALAEERDQDLRRTILTSIIRAGGAAAIPVLESVKARHADLARDADDYLVELRRGVTDMEQLSELKQRKDAARSTSAVAAQNE